MTTAQLDTYYQQGSKTVIDKDPNAVLPYSFDWTDWLADLGDGVLIASVTFPMHESLVLEDSNHNGLVAVAVVGGGAEATEEQPLIPMTCRITTNTSPPYTDDRTIWFKIKQR